MRIFVLCIVFYFLVTTIVEADLVDFESGFVDLQQVGTVTTATNIVNFAIGEDTPIAPGWIIEAGSAHIAFEPGNTPTNGSQFSLTDTDGTHSLGETLNYFISFSQPVLNLSLDLYDYRASEGSVKVGDTATLTVFSDVFSTPVGSDIFTITAGLPDGNVANLSVSSPSANIYSAVLTYSGEDGGNAIDNIEFETVPEAIVVKSILPNHGSVCGGTSVIISR